MTTHRICYNIQIINGYECDGTDIFMRLKIECCIQIKNIHNSFYVTSKIYYNTFIYCVRPKVTAVHHWTLHCSIARYYWTLTSHAFNGLFHFIWPCIVQSNDKNLHRCYINTDHACPPPPCSFWNKQCSLAAILCLYSQVIMILSDQSAITSVRQSPISTFVIICNRHWSVLIQHSHLLFCFIR